MGMRNDACHSIKMDIDPCMAGRVADEESMTPSLIASRMGLMPP